MRKKTAVIIGAGVMGQGVAQTLVQNQYSIYLYDLNSELIGSAIKSIQKKICIDSMFGNNLLAVNIKDIVSYLHPLETLEHLSQVDLIIENITEDTQAKKTLYKNMANHINQDCKILANTSCISITELASYLPNPGNVIGAHFMNPVPLIGTVELVKGFHTTQHTIDVALEFLSSIDKKGILVNDFPGFVTNRISHLMMNEAAFVVQDQVASIEDVDKIFKECYGHKMGPLELADLIGLDTVVRSLKVLYESYQDPKFRCCPLLMKMVNAGLLGRKSGQGFYTY